MKSIQKGIKGLVVISEVLEKTVSISIRYNLIKYKTLTIYALVTSYRLVLFVVIYTHNLIMIILVCDNTFTILYIHVHLCTCTCIFNPCRVYAHALQYLVFVCVCMHVSVTTVAASSLS